MSEFKLEDGIPLPENKFQGVTAYLRAMTIGQSFLVPAHLRNLHGIAARLKIRIKTRKECDSVRVWRIE